MFLYLQCKKSWFDERRAGRRQVTKFMQYKNI